VLRHVVVAILFLMTPNVVRGQIAQQPQPTPTENSHTADTPETQHEVLTLADLESIAIGNHPGLAAAAARINIARGKYVQAGLYPNPVAGYHATEIGNQSTAGQQGGFLSQRLITGGKLVLDQAMATKDVTSAQFQFHAQELRVLSDVRVRFYDALISQQRVVLTEKLAQIGDQLVEATEKLIEGRQGTENDLLQAEIRADESRILLDNARNQYLESWRRLITVAGVPSLRMTPLYGELESDLPVLDWENCSAQVLSGNPELNAARARVDRARIAIQRAKKEPVPNVDIFVSHRHHNVTDDNVTNVQVGIPLPVFDRNQGNICSAEAEWVAACHDVRRMELQLQDRLAVAFRQYANARQQAERYSTRMVPRAQQSLRLVTEGYQKGQVEYLTLLTAQSTYLQVSLSRLDSLLALRTASSVIASQLLTDSLAERR